MPSNKKNATNFFPYLIFIYICAYIYLLTIILTFFIFYLSLTKCYFDYSDHLNNPEREKKEEAYRT